MKTKLSAIILFASACAFAWTISPVAYMVRSQDTTFVMPHAVYGDLPGVIEAKTGQAYGLNISKEFGRIRLSTEALYVSVPLKRVAVAGKEKNWGDKADGWQASVGLGYKLSLLENWRVVPSASVGYQDLLGGGATASVGVDIERSIWKNGSVALSVREQWSQDTKYEGLTVDNGLSTFVGIKLGWRF